MNEKPDTNGEEVPTSTSENNNDTKRQEYLRQQKISFFLLELNNGADDNLYNPSDEQKEEFSNISFNDLKQNGQFNYCLKFQPLVLLKLVESQPKKQKYLLTTIIEKMTKDEYTTDIFDDLCAYIKNTAPEYISIITEELVGKMEELINEDINFNWVHVLSALKIMDQKTFFLQKEKALNIIDNWLNTNTLDHQKKILDRIGAKAITRDAQSNLEIKINSIQEICDIIKSL